MLNLNCVICAELFAQSDEVYVTICGHLFHHNCLNQWLDRSKTCPQCRNKCTTRHIWRVYFNLANLDVSRIDVGSLQEQLDNAHLAVKMKEKEFNKVEQQLKELKDTQKKCLKTIAGLEQKVLKKDFLVSSYVEQISLLKSEAQLLDGLRRENKSLKLQIQSMEGISAILAAGSADAELLLKNEANPQVLASWVSTLKRELRQCENKKSELRNVIKLVQNDLRKEIDLKRMMEERISHLESDLYQNQEKLLALEREPISVDSPNSSTGLNSNIMALKHGEKRATISPTIKENIKRIEESNSPYLNIKSSSVGLSHLLSTKGSIGFSKANISPIMGASGVSMTSGTVRKTTSDLSSKYSIFKKPRLLLGSSSSGVAATMGSNFVYNGMGGSEKIDPFAQRTEEESQANSAQAPPLSKNVNQRLKAGTLRNFKLGK
ncbi:E3 ubiquitin-protein ligase TRAIP [Drosophila guanche]|uniref:Blast:E3 ubiquitin-protein ligase TRAIP n=1 Tax=Drosophila guanche TaxID=7266 RepID=A0A3B0JQG6_DROGU|nr:E3 ubiquitin-protein ligase TRAIP [Drosophila guanche]SPP75899.1 blast:E3 ubiquitin-protein ligase TRAIP [Drosophila guanche]